MKILIHQRALHLYKVVSPSKEEIQLKSSSLNDAFWELGERFPNEWIGWCEGSYFQELNFEAWEEVFYNDFVMASMAIETDFFSDKIGYIDQLPSCNIREDIFYGTWRMSSDMGGIKGAVLNEFRPLFQEISDFGFLLNSIGKLGQQNSLFCYRAPELRKLTSFQDSEKKDAIKFQSSSSQLFRFVYQHYNTAWTGILLLNFIIYENSFPLGAFFRSFFGKKYFRRAVSFDKIKLSERQNNEALTTIDVILPTLGRPDYLFNFLKDLSVQTFLPEKVIIIEQNPENGAVSTLPFLEDNEWPFRIVHHLINRVGVCNARNIAIKEVSSDWVFFADDDIRIDPNLLKRIIAEAEKYNFCGINLNCKQKEEVNKFNKIKQWGAFGSGSSVVKSYFVHKSKFSEIYEHGYGEDLDFGMQLRNHGCDLVYHPDLEIFHLKAPSGGFREKSVLPWEEDEPKPSPTVMSFIKQHYTKEQIAGYKTELFLRFYFKQEVKNPMKYLKRMRERWRKSEEWADRLIRRNSSTEYPNY